MKLRCPTQTDRYFSITEAHYVSGYRIRLIFSDGTEQVVDFEPFLRKAQHPDLTQYKQLRMFRSFRVHYGNLIWGDYEMIFPVADLHSGRI